MWCYGVTQEVPMPLCSYTLEYCLTILRLLFEYYSTMVCNKKEEERSWWRFLFWSVMARIGWQIFMMILLPETHIMSTTNRHKRLTRRDMHPVFPAIGCVVGENHMACASVSFLTWFLRKRKSLFIAWIYISSDFIRCSKKENWKLEEC